MSIEIRNLTFQIKLEFVLFDLREPLEFEEFLLILKTNIHKYTNAQTIV